MIAALIMLGYAAALAWFGAAPLARLTTSGVNARLGLTVWFVAMSSALGSAVVAVAFLVRTAVNGWPRFAGTICQSVTGAPCPPQLYRSAIFEASVAAEVNGKWGKATVLPGLLTLAKHEASSQTEAVSCPAASRCEAVGSVAIAGQPAVLFAAGER